MPKKILVTGATGTVATSTIPLLLEGGASVRAMVHDARKAASLREAGAEVVQGDYDTREGLDAAFRGVNEAFLIAPPGPRAAEQMHHLIEAAKAAGVDRVVRLSALKAAPDAPTANGRLHHESDTELERSGLGYTILRPHFYMQNLLMSVPTIRQEGKLYMGMGDGKLGTVDTRDVADCAARILLEGGHERATYTPTGPDRITLHDAARSIGDATGKPVTYVPVPPEAVRDSLLQMGMGDWFADVMADYSRAYAAGWGDFTTKDVEAITGRPPRSVRTFANEVLAPGLR